VAVALVFMPITDVVVGALGGIICPVVGLNTILVLHVG